MLKTFVVALLFVSTALFAQEKESKHMVMFGNQFTAGWSGSASRADVDSRLGIDNLDIMNGEFNINYAYKIAPQIQIGIDIAAESTTNETKYNAGGKVKSEEDTSSLTLFGIFNFSENIQDSFYFGVGLGRGWSNEETKDTTEVPVEKAKTESNMTLYYLAFGKRFNLEFMGIQNLTYSPGIAYSHFEMSGDLEDQGVNSISNFRIDIMKFDLLF